MAYEENKSVNYGFPRHDISPTKKNKAWHLQYSKAFHKEYNNSVGKLMRWMSDEYAEWRLYAAGKQDPDQYKERLGTKKRKGKNDRTWRNLDWSILPIFPRFLTVIKERLLKQHREIMLQAIDQTSISKERKRKAEMLDFIANRDFYEEASRATGVPLKSPFEPGEPIPENSSEVDIHVQMYPKNKYIMYMKDQIELAFEYNNWKQKEEDIMDDLLKIGLSGTRVWLDINGAIKISRVIGDKMISNVIQEKDFSDQIRIGYYEQVTISQLRSQVKKGTFSEEDYCVIANSAQRGTKYDIINNAQYMELHNCYPYDHERITILREEWFSADDLAYVVTKNNKGNTTIQKRDNPGWLGEKTDQEYKEFYKLTKNEEREIIRDGINRTYECSWIVDTDFVFNYGPVTNMIRNVGTLKDVESSFSMYAMDVSGDSLVRQCMPILDNIQINWLQYQHHLAKSKPNGLAIEKRALGAVDLGNGHKLSSGQVLQMYAETGSYIYTGTDANGRPYPYKPIEELLGGISPAAQGHLNFILQDIDMLRAILGLNEQTDASTPNPEIGKGVSEMANLNTNNALGTIYHAFLSIYERTAKKICMLVPEAAKIPNKGRLEALGYDNAAYVNANRDIPFLELGIKVYTGASDELKAKLTMHLNASLKVNGGVLLPEDAYVVENEQNIQRAYLILAQKRRLREKEEQERQKDLMKTQADGNTQTAVATEEAKRATMAMEIDLFREKTTIETEAKILAIREEKQWDVIMEKIKAGSALSVAEEATYAKLLSTEMTVRAQIQVSKDNAQKKEKSTLQKSKK